MKRTLNARCAPSITRFISNRTASSAVRIRLPQPGAAPKCSCAAEPSVSRKLRSSQLQARKSGLRTRLPDRGAHASAAPYSAGISRTFLPGARRSGHLPEASASGASPPQSFAERLKSRLCLLRLFFRVRSRAAGREISQKHLDILRKACYTEYDKGSYFRRSM